MSSPSSPCVGVCSLDEPRALCLGCGRTIDEIVGWGALPESLRRAVMAELPGRLAAGDRLPNTPTGPATLDAEAGHPQLI